MNESTTRAEHIDPAPAAAGWGVLALLFFLLPTPASAQTFSLSLPGTLVSATGVTGPSGRPGVALLLAAGRDGKGAKSLLFLDPERRSLQRWIDNLHEETNAVTAFDWASRGHAGRGLRSGGRGRGAQGVERIERGPALGGR
jgi:hypothetical protein